MQTKMQKICKKYAKIRKQKCKQICKQKMQTIYKKYANNMQKVLWRREIPAKQGRASGSVAEKGKAQRVNR